MMSVNIAFTGVYDIDNYGDHLFPIVFKNAMKKRNIDCNLFLFSPTSREKQGFNQENKIYPLCDIAKLHEKYCFDAVVVGGGEILHFHAFKHKMANSEYSIYPIYNVWTIPSLFCEEYGVPLLWNNPGAPFKFEGIYELLAKQMISKVDYVSVRNKFTFNTIKSLEICNVNLSVDTAFYLPKVLNKKDLLEEVRGLDLKNKYVVFHCNKLISQEYLNIAIDELLLLYQQGYKIILLPLAYTNGDDDFARKINDIVSNKFITFEGELSILEIISILANTKLYIGVSFHGAITSYVYGKKVIAFDFFSNKKTKDLFELMGLEDNYITDANNLDEAISNVLNTTYMYEEKHKEIISLLDVHFDQVASILLETKKKNKGRKFYGEFTDMLTALSLELQESQETIINLTNEKNYNLLNWQKCSNELIEMYNDLEKEREKNKQLQETINYYKPVIDSKLINAAIKLKKR